MIVSSFEPLKGVMSNSANTSKAGKLERPCVLLKRDGSADMLAGVWRGEGVVCAPSGPFRHWISVDCRFLPEGFGASIGVLSVYTNEHDCVSGFAAYESTARIQDPGRRALFAHIGRSLPPPDAMCVEDDEEYQHLWKSNCPIYSKEIVAVLGGWHFPWPDGDWEHLQDQRLLVWTIEEAEPWVEVWGELGSLRVIQRIT